VEFEHIFQGVQNLNTFFILRMAMDRLLMAKIHIHYLIAIFIGVSTSSFGKENYLKSIESGNFKIPDPETSEEFFQKEFKIIYQYEQTRSLEDCALGKQQHNLDFRSLYLGNKSPKIKNYHEKEIKELSEFLEQVLAYAKVITAPFKLRHGRKRPYEMDKELNTCVPRPGHGLSYPSYHSVAGALSACFMMDIYPSYKNAFKAYGEKVGLLRVMGGVHFPSDVKVGRQLGQDICAHLVKQPSFLKKYNTLKKELGIL
jgi:acid phosphatase (class A)